MSKLDDIIIEHREWMRGVRTDHLIGSSSGETKLAIKNLMKELIGEPEYRKTGDMSLQSWTSEDYKQFGKNELIIEIIQKVEQL